LSDDTQKIVEMSHYRLARQILDSLEPADAPDFIHCKPPGRTHILRMHPFYTDKLASKPDPIQTPDSLADLLYFPYLGLNFHQ
jgi:hypothetical protein